MKKHYTLMLIAATASSMMMAQPSQKLAKIESTIVPDNEVYFYDETNCRLDSATEYSVDDEWEYVTAYKYIYDEKGNEILQKGYQKFTGDDFYTYSTQIHYTYDEQNRVVTRINYNLSLDHTQFEIGGTYVYVYDGDKLVERNDYWGLETTDENLFSHTEYTYNEDGTLKTEYSYAPDFFTSEMMFSYGLDYIYDDQGRLVEKEISYLDYSTYQPVKDGGEIYKWDDNGNIVEWVNYSGDNPENVIQREEYAYDLNMLSSDCLFPATQEWDGEIYTKSHNALSSITVYSMTNEGTLGLYDISEMTYEPFGSGSGIAGIKAKDKVMQARCADGIVSLSGVDYNEMVRIYNTAGLMMNVNRYNPSEGIDINNLPAGVYIIATKQGTAKIMKK